MPWSLYLWWYQQTIFESPINVITTEHTAILIKVCSGPLNSALLLNGVHTLRLLTGMPIIICANFKNLVLWNQTSGAWVQPKVIDGHNHNPTICELSDGHREAVVYFSG